jgi:hypothetical protein
MSSLLNDQAKRVQIMGEIWVMLWLQHAFSELKRLKAAA